MTPVIKELRWMAWDEYVYVKFMSYLVNLCKKPLSPVAMSFLQQTLFTT